MNRTSLPFFYNPLNIIENLDAISNLNGMTKREIIYDLVKYVHDIEKADSLLKQMIDYRIIEFQEISNATNVILSESYIKQKNSLILSERFFVLPPTKHALIYFFHSSHNFGSIAFLFRGENISP